jgi:hypothetical protein
MCEAHARWRALRGRVAIVTVTTFSWPAAPRATAAELR